MSAEPDAQPAVAEPRQRASVTCVVLNYEGRHLLDVILPSLAAQTYAPFDVLVVDDASRDDSRAYLAERWPDVEVLANERNVGVAAALNRGVAAARGEYVALLNNDLELAPTWLAEMVAGLERHPEAGAVACKLCRYDERERLDGTGDQLTRRMVLLARGRGELDRGQYDREDEILSPTAGAALYRASALARVGPFDESFWAYFEDVDWGLRAQLAGLPSWYVPRAVAYHMGGATTGGDRSPAYLVLHQRNRIGLMVKDLPLSLLARNAPAILREQAGTLVHGVKQRTLGLYLKAWWGAALHLPGWLRARRRIQRRRRVPASRLGELLVD
jgi:GT2 family glycosyltransferase